MLFDRRRFHCIIERLNEIYRYLMVVVVVRLLLFLSIDTMVIREEKEGEVQ